MELDEDTCRRAVCTRDARFDGRLVVGGHLSGRYCRPSCPDGAPARGDEVVLFGASAAARAAGLRACPRCLPDAVPGSPEWNLRADVAARAMRLIGDGVVARYGVAGLARLLGCSPEHLTAVLSAELGAGPLELALAHRAHTARLLIQETALDTAVVAVAAGFTGLRQLDDTLLAVFGLRSGALRAAAKGLSGDSHDGRNIDSRSDRDDKNSHDRNGHGRPCAIALRLPVRTPMDGAGLLSFLAKRAVPGVESAVGGWYGRTLALPHGPATVWLSFGEAHLDTVLRLDDLRDLGTVVHRVRRLVDADADPASAGEVLAADPALAPVVLATPGIRVPGTVDGREIVLRAMLGQQVSVAAARTATGRLAMALGTILPVGLRTGPPAAPDVRPTGPIGPVAPAEPAMPVDEPGCGALTRLFPSPAQVAEHGTEVLAGPRRRIAAVLTAAAALASGELRVHPGRDPVELSRDLRALPGIGPWTAGYVAMRVLGAPDVLLSSDLMVRRGARVLGIPATVAGLNAYSRRWRPWRSYAGMYLWRASATTW